MRYGSVCSGVEAASLAWMPLGWEAVFFAEVEPFPCAVLQQRFNATKPLRPLDSEDASEKKDRRMRENWLKQLNRLPAGGTIPNLGDFTKIKESDYHGQIDLLVGGTPCQDLSVAGKRAGFDGKRSSLAIEFVRQAYELGCKWVVWENVPGTLSSRHGRDFATLLSLFTGCEVGTPEQRRFDSAGFVCPARRDRFGVAWRVLDARFVRTPRFPRGIPQRRRRLFLVGCLGDWTAPAQILFDRESLQGNPAALGATGAPVPATSEGGTAYWWDESEFADTITRTSSEQRMPDKKRFQAVIVDKHMCKSSGYAPALEKEGAHELVTAAFMSGQGEKARGLGYSEDCSPTIRASKSGTNQVPSLLCFHGAQDPIFNEDHANTIGRNQGQKNCIMQTSFPTIDSNIYRSLNFQDNNKYVIESGKGFYRESTTAETLEQHEDQHRRNLVCTEALFLRRLTPVECERLMGFPDNHTRIEWNGKSAEKCPDGPRYKACGNSMCVNCMEWIGLRIKQIAAQDERTNNQ